MRRACVAAAHCACLTQADAGFVGQQWFHHQAGLGWKGAFDLLDDLIIEADPALAAKKQEQAAATRAVVLWGHSEGAIDITARMDALDALYLDATIDQLADILLTDEAHSGFTKQVMRAKALGIIATPALALALQQQGLNPATGRGVLQPALVDAPDDERPTRPVVVSALLPSSMELDHTIAYRRSHRDAQTGVGLMAPLHHQAHHAKTVAAWLARQRIPGEIVWTSPLGFRYTVTAERTTALE